MKRLENTKDSLVELSKKTIEGNNISIVGKPRTGKTWAVVNILNNIDNSTCGIKILSYLVGAYKHLGYGTYCEELNIENVDMIFSQMDLLFDKRIQKIKLMEPLEKAVLILDDVIHSQEDSDRVYKLMQKAIKARVTCIYSGSYRLNEQLNEMFPIKIATVLENDTFYCEED